MSKTQTQFSGHDVGSAVDGMAAALPAKRRAQPSSSGFKIELHSPPPSDPRGDLPAVKSTMLAYEERNDRVAIGLRCGFRRLEMNQIPDTEMKSVLAAIRREKSEREAAKSGSKS